MTIPAKLNLALTVVTIAVLASLLALAGAAHGWALGAVALAYGVAMNTGYALLHEAEHGMLHPNGRLNAACGIALGVFFPAPFHLLRQGHLGHHMRNRSDDEAFDFYFADESRLWRWLQLYGVLTGLFWLVIAASNVVSAAAPSLLRARVTPFDRATVAFQETLNPRYTLWIRLEALAAIAFHAGWIALFHIPIGAWFATLAGFGFLWSAMQYAHHFGTPRDVLTGARNLKTFTLLDRVWLNHNWHLNHHLRPTVPWIHLPSLSADEEERGSLVGAYLRMWVGPRLTAERVENRFAGRIIQ